MNYRTLAGRIDYVTDDVGVRGAENFYITIHEDGSRVLRACCEMHDEVLVRDVLLALDANFAPLRANVHLMVGGRFHGVGDYQFESGAVHFQGQRSGEAVVTKTVALDSPAPSFGSHSVQNDAWAYGAFDRHRDGAAECVIAGIPITSKLPNGGDGPTVILAEHRHRYVGEEQITVPAGQFQCRHYQFLFDDWPAIDYWVHGPDYLMVKCRWDLLRQSYILTELREG